MQNRLHQSRREFISHSSASLCALSSIVGSQGRALIPKIDGDWWPIAGQPDLGELTSDKQQPVDFAVWRAADGTWQLWSCIRSTKEAGHTRLFHRWEAANLTDRNWTPKDIAMRADPKLGECLGGLQAPYVFKDGSRFIMFYGDWEHICMATSRDGKTFERVIQPNGQTGMFSEGAGANTRDPMVLRIGDLWHCYYTAFPTQKGAVFVRTSPDFKEWTERRVASAGGKGGDGPFSAECPHVVKRDMLYYLFRTQFYGTNNVTHVYRSDHPMEFGRNEDEQDWITSLPVAAPEIVSHEGWDYIAALNPELNGIRMAKLKWDEAK